MLGLSRLADRRLVALIALCSASSGAGCFFPEYTFEDGSGGATSTSSSSTTATSTTDTVSSSVGTGGAGGMMMLMEDCFNGVDDDGDEKADCDDPDCEPATECVDAIPAGYGSFGYVLIGEGSPSSPPGCPSFAPSAKYAGFETLNNTGHSCSNCGCTTPSMQSCAVSKDLDVNTAGTQLFQVRNVPCANGNATNLRTLTVPTPWDLTCDSSNTATGGQTCVGQPCNSSIFADFAVVSGGKCDPTGGVATKANPGWQTASKACNNPVAMAGCLPGLKCVPKGAGAQFSQHVCVGKAGDVSCPAPFSNKRVYYESFMDSRGCTMCDCNDPAGSTCTVSLTVSTDGACGTDILSFDSGTCADLPGNPTVSGRQGAITVAPHGGGCTPKSLASLKTGDVLPAMPTTFCCL